MVQNEAIQNLQNRWNAFDAREQTSLKLLAVALTLFLAYFAMWVPAETFLKDSQRELEDGRKLLALVQSSGAALKESGAGSQATANMNSQQLASTVTSMARKQKLSLKRFEPSGENKVKVWVEDVSFDTLVSWLSVLDKSIGVKVEQISVEKQNKPGVVSARLTLSS